MKFPCIASMILFFGLINPIEAKSTGSSSSGFSGSRSSSSSSFKPSSSSSFKPSSSSTSSSNVRTGSSGPSTSNKSWSSSSSTTKASTPIPTKVNGSKVDASVYQAAVKSGTVYKSKDDAIAAFKQKNAATYTNKFDTEPTSRPSYIPSSTRVGGNTYNVSYNSQYHGYGYYGPSGVWTAYDTFRDTMMLAALMDRDNYVVTSPNPVVVQHSSGMGFFKWILGIVVIGFILIVAIAMFTPNKLRY